MQDKITSIPSSDYKPVTQQMYAERIYRLTGKQVEPNRVTIDAAEILRIKAIHVSNTNQELLVADINTKVQLISVQSDISYIESFNDQKNVSETVDYLYEQVNTGYEELSDIQAMITHIAEEAKRLSEEHIRGLKVHKGTIESFKDQIKELKQKQQTVAKMLSETNNTIDSYSKYRNRALDIAKPAIPDIEQERPSLPSPAA